MNSLVTRLLVIGSVLFAISNCQPSDQRDIRDYYFPVKQLTEGRVYEYQVATQKAVAPDYWYYLTVPTDSAYYFTKTHYRADFTQQQLTREEMVNSGMLTDALYLFETDSSGQQQQIVATIESPNAFPFQVQDETFVYLYKARFQLPSQPNGQTTFIINRRFQGDTTFVYQGETYPAVKFSIEGLVDQRDSIIGDIEPHFWGEEIYAKQLGLVSYRRDYDQSQPGFTYQLKTTHAMKKFAEMAENTFK